MTPHPGAAVPIEDGDVLPLLGGLEVIHTPGHTPGSVCLYARGPRILFTGDVIQVRRGRLAFASPIFSHDHAQARASVRRLTEFDVDIIAFSHYRPMREGASEALAALASQAAH
jgi:glyoxylase-like metal-dependent hydrolase (beta-lactamase superfamily II)